MLAQVFSATLLFVFPGIQRVHTRGDKEASHVTAILAASDLYIKSQTTADALGGGLRLRIA
jgi:hypothetical protein